MTTHASYTNSPISLSWCVKISLPYHIPKTCNDYINSSHEIEHFFLLCIYTSNNKQTMQLKTWFFLFEIIRTCSISKLFCGLKSVQYNDGPLFGTWSLAHRLTINPNDTRIIPNKFIISIFLIIFFFFFNSRFHTISLAYNYLIGDKFNATRIVSQFCVDGQPGERAWLIMIKKYVWFYAPQPNNWKSQFEFFYSDVTQLKAISHVFEKRPCMRQPICEQNMFMRALVTSTLLFLISLNTMITEVTQFSRLAPL